MTAKSSVGESTNRNSKLKRSAAFPAKNGVAPISQYNFVSFHFEFRDNFIFFSYLSLIVRFLLLENNVLQPFTCVFVQFGTISQ